jgi:hypothetical protein
VGYAKDSIVRGTGTNATGSSTKFAGDANDFKYAGFITATGMNASGYNPTAATGTILTLTKVGGGAPAFPVDGSLPWGCRVRWDVGTTTAGLRNVSFPVWRVRAGTIEIDTSITTVASDKCYLEMPGLAVPAYSLGPNNQGISLLGVRSIGRVDLAGYGGGLFHFYGCAATRMQPIFCSISSDQTFNHPNLGVIKIGMGFRDEDVSELGDCDSHLALWCATKGLIVTNVINHEDPGAMVFGRYFIRGTLPLVGVTHEHAVIGNGGAQHGVGAPTLLCIADVDQISLELNSAQITIDGLQIDDNLGGGIQLKGLCNVAIGPFGIKGTATSLAGLDISQARRSNIVIADPLTFTATGTKADLAICAGPENNTLNVAFAPLSTITNLILGCLPDCAGNIIIGGINGDAGSLNARLVGAVVGLKNTTGGAVPQFAIITEGGAHNIFLAKADSFGNAAGLPMVMLTPALANNDWIVAALQVMRVPLIFDAAPAQGVIVYLSEVNAGQVQTAVPAVSATHQKFRLGLTTRNASGVSVNAAYFNPELYPLAADGLK